MYSNDFLLKSIRRRILIAKASLKTFSNEDALAFGDEELVTRLYPQIMQVRQEYAVYRLDIPLVMGRPDYRIPSRAIAGKLRSLHLVAPSGHVLPLIRKEPGEAEVLDDTTQGVPGFFFLESHSIHLRPVPNDATYKVRMSFYIRPNQLVELQRAGTVEEVDTDTNRVTIQGPASGWDINKRYDILRGTPGFEHFAIDERPVAFDIIGDGMYSVEFDSSVNLSRLDVGDYVCLAGEAPVPQIPADLHPILAQRVAVKLLEGTGDDGGLERARAQLAEMESLIADMLAPRVEDQRQVVTSYARKWLG